MRERGTGRGDEAGGGASGREGDGEREWGLASIRGLASTTLKFHRLSKSQNTDRFIIYIRMANVSGNASYA